MSSSSVCVRGISKKTKNNLVRKNKKTKTKTKTNQEKPGIISTTLHRQLLHISKPLFILATLHRRNLKSEIWKTHQSALILDLYWRKTRAGKSRDYEKCLSLDTYSKSYIGILVFLCPKQLWRANYEFPSNPNRHHRRFHYTSIELSVEPQAQKLIPNRPF